VLNNSAIQCDGVISAIMYSVWN